MAPDRTSLPRARPGSRSPLRVVPQCTEEEPRDRPRHSRQEHEQGLGPRDITTLMEQQHRKLLRIQHAQYDGFARLTDTAPPSAGARSARGRSSALGMHVGSLPTSGGPPQREAVPPQREAAHLAAPVPRSRRRTRTLQRVCVSCASSCTLVELKRFDSNMTPCTLCIVSV